MTMETRSRYWGRIPYVTGSSQVIFVFIGGTHVGQSRAGGCFRGIGANAAQVQVQCASHGCSRGLHRCAATADWRSVAHSPARNGRKACAQLSLRAPRVVVELEDTHTSPLASRVTRAFVHWTSTQSTHQCSLFWLVVSAQLRKPRNFSRKELSSMWMRNFYLFCTKTSEMLLLAYWSGRALASLRSWNFMRDWLLVFCKGELVNWI